MARRRRPAPHTSVETGRARIIIPIESVMDPDGHALGLGDLAAWLSPVDDSSGSVGDAGPGAAIVLDRFAWDLHLADVGYATDTHDGDAFFDAAVSRESVIVYVVAGLDPRRSNPSDLDAAGRGGDLVGALVPAFAVDVLQS